MLRFENIFSRYCKILNVWKDFAKLFYFIVFNNHSIKVKMFHNFVTHCDVSIRVFIIRFRWVIFFIMILVEKLSYIPFMLSNWNILTFIKEFDQLLNQSTIPSTIFFFFIFIVVIIWITWINCIIMSRLIIGWFEFIVIGISFFRFSRRLYWRSFIQPFFWFWILYFFRVCSVFSIVVCIFFVVRVFKSTNDYLIHANVVF